MKISQYLFNPYAHGNTRDLEVVIYLSDRNEDPYWEYSEAIEFILQLYKTRINKILRVNITNGMI